MAREMYLVCKRMDCEPQVYLDMTGITQAVWEQTLSELREECRHYLRKDPARKPIPIEPGIHYFMGGILVDQNHRTNIQDVYAAGECACQYHGANRLGGNSMLGAIYGGKIAAQSALEDLEHWKEIKHMPLWISKGETEDRNVGDMPEISSYLGEGLGLVRSEEGLKQAMKKLEKLLPCVQSNEAQKKRLLLGLAMLRSAYERKESRGAHFRCDYPKSEEEYRKTTVAFFDGCEIRIEFRKISGGVQ